MHLKIDIYSIYKKNTISNFYYFKLRQIENFNIVKWNPFSQKIDNQTYITIIIKNYFYLIK